MSGVESMQMRAGSAGGQTLLLTTPSSLPARSHHIRLDHLTVTGLTTHHSAPVAARLTLADIKRDEVEGRAWTVQTSQPTTDQQIYGQSLVHTPPCAAEK